MGQKKLQLVEVSADSGEKLVVPGENIFDVYRPAEALELVTVCDRRMIRFGYTGAFGTLLLDLASGNIVERLHDDDDVKVVNTSLAAFNSCLEAFLDKFPLDDIEDEDAADERNAQVARQIESELTRIDPNSYVEGSFWYEVRWGVAIGDFAS
jgi:hypothetical protein